MDDFVITGVSLYPTWNNGSISPMISLCLNNIMPFLKHQKHLCDYSQRIRLIKAIANFKTIGLILFQNVGVKFLLKLGIFSNQAESAIPS